MAKQTRVVFLPEAEGNAAIPELIERVFKLAGETDKTRAGAANWIDISLDQRARVIENFAKTVYGTSMVNAGRDLPDWLARLDDGVKKNGDA